MPVRTPILRRALACVPMLGAPAIAQTGGVPADAAVRVEPPVKFNASLNLTSAYAFSHGVNAGGDVRTFDAALNLVFLATLDEKRRLIFTYNSAFTHYDFSGASGTAFDEPWDDIIGLTLGARYIQRITPKIDLIAGLSARSDREIGADFADSLALSGFVGGRYALREGLSLGLGVVVVTQLEDDPTVFPIPLVEWAFAEGWTLSTVSSPIGAAVEYTAKDQAFSIALSAGYESRNFRLDSIGVAPEGAGTDRRLLVSLEGTLNVSHQFSIGATLGINAWQKFKIEDDQGNDVAETDADPSGFVGITATFRF